VPVQPVRDRRLRRVGVGRQDGIDRRRDLRRVLLLSSVICAVSDSAEVRLPDAERVRQLGK
jgi:hypothetical protein